MMALFWSSIVTTSLTSVLPLFFVSPIFAVTTCPNNVLAEKGSDCNITCTTSETTVDLYWYKGKAKEQDLVGKLENGSVSISQRYRESYDIGPSGSLKIRNAGISHESLYTLLTFDLNGTPEEDGVFLNITISPYPPCPIINDCTPCNKCYLNNSIGSGTLTCKVEGVRPLIHLSWKATAQTGIGLLERQPVEMEQRAAGSWDISVALDYNVITSCGAKAILHCMAEGTAPVLQSTVSTVEISNGPCNLSETTENPADQNITRAGTSAKTWPVLIVLAILIFILVVVVLIMCCIFCHRQRGEELHDEINTNQQSKKDSQILPMGSPSFQCLAFQHTTTDASGNTTTISGGFVALRGHEGVATSKLLALE